MLYDLLVHIKKEVMETAIFTEVDKDVHELAHHVNITRRTKMIITIVDRARIRALTAEKGLTVAGLIRKSGVSQGTLLNVMTGVRTPPH